NRHALVRPLFRQRPLHQAGPLTCADSVPILMFPSTQRKEVIQCLLPSAVTSLGSPAKLFSGLAKGALSAWTSELQKLRRDGSNPAAPFCLGWGFIVIPGARRRNRP